MITSNKAQELTSELDETAARATTATELMKAIVEKLRRLAHYDWVGFYMLEQQNQVGVEPVLVLGPYAGAPTPHTRIPLNQGICGAAASSGETVIVDDVNSDPRYLACSIETKSEIVVPVYANGKVVGELDIDSHVHTAFGPEDRMVCEQAAKLLGRVIEMTGR